MSPGTVLAPIRDTRRVIGAFMWLGFTEAMAYPLMIVISFIVGPSAVPVMYYFIARLVDSGAEVGFDYYTFAMLGFITANALVGGLTAFGQQLNSAIQQGRFETFLVQPVSWYSLPFALATWPMVQTTLVATVMALTALALGMNIEFTRLPAALLVTMLAMAASHAIGTLASSVRLLSKKADPVVAVYTVVASVFSGVLFPVSMLPAVIRPIAYLLPQTYALSAVRRILMPAGDQISGPSLPLSIGMLLGLTVLLYAIGLFAFGRALEFGRRYGILGGY